MVPGFVPISPVHLPGGFEVTCLRPEVDLQTRLSLGQDGLTTPLLKPWPACSAQFSVFPVSWSTNCNLVQQRLSIHSPKTPNAPNSETCWKKFQMNSEPATPLAPHASDEMPAPLDLEKEKWPGMEQARLMVRLVNQGAAGPRGA